MLKRYTDAELKGFLDALKSDRLERKETFKEDVPKMPGRPSVLLPMTCRGMTNPASFLSAPKMTAALPA